jgi:hypothetical protein
MRNLLLLLSIIISEKSYSQCVIYFDADYEIYTKECESCYKKIKYPYISVKNKGDDCANKQLDCFITTLRISYYMSYYKRYDLVSIRTTARSKCSESYSGKHLWKEIDVQSESLFKHQKFTNEKDFCKVLEYMGKQNLESYIGCLTAIEIIDELEEY